MSRDKDLEYVCEVWLRTALDILKGVPLPVKDDLEVTFSSNGYNAKGIRTIDIGFIYIVYRQQLFSLPEYGNIVKLILDTPDLLSALCIDAAGNIIAEPEQQKNWLERYFATLLHEYLQSDLSLSFLPSVFNKLYEQFEEYIYGTQPFVGVWSVHIRNLQLEEDSFKIKGGLYLRKATHAEKTSAIKMVSNPDSLQIPDIPETFLDIYQQIDRTASQKSAPNVQEVIHTAERLLLALRLLKPQQVGIASYQWTTLEQPFVIYKGIRNPMMLRPSDYKGEPYLLENNDTEELLKLWRSTKQALNESELAIALSRFGDSYVRTKLEDKLIDYWVALEALFFALINKEYIGNMGETVASTISYYLGTTANGRRGIYAAMISSHTARGYFVHGQRGKKVESLDLVVKNTEKYLRMALRKRIEENEN